MKTIRLWLLILTTPIQRFMQLLHPPELRTTHKFVETAKHAIKPGRVFLTWEPWHFTNMFIPGFWSHAAIYIGRDAVLESIGSGVRLTHIDEFLYTKGHVLALDPTFLDEECLEDITSFGLAQVGEPYDYLFRSGVKAWFCSEIVFACLKEACRGQRKRIFTLRRTWGVSTVKPQDFENAVAKGKFRIVADTRELWMHKYHIR